MQTIDNELNDYLLTAEIERAFRLKELKRNQRNKHVPIQPALARSTIIKFLRSLKRDLHN